MYIGGLYRYLRYGVPSIGSRHRDVDDAGDPFRSDRVVTVLDVKDGYVKYTRHGVRTSSLGVFWFREFYIPITQQEEVAKALMK